MPKGKTRKRDNKSLRVALLQRTPQKYVAALKMNNEENPGPSNDSISSSTTTNNFDNILNDSSKENEHQSVASEPNSLETSLDLENTITSMDSNNSNKLSNSLNGEEKENLSSLDNSTGFRKALMSSNEEENGLDDTLVNQIEQNINSELNSKSNVVSKMPNTNKFIEESEISQSNCSSVNDSAGFQKALMTSNEETNEVEVQEEVNDITLVSSTTVSPNTNKESSSSLDDSIGFQKVLISSNEEIQQNQKGEIELNSKKEKQKSELEKSKRKIYNLIKNLKQKDNDQLENNKFDEENKSKSSNNSKDDSSNKINPSQEEQQESNNNPSTSGFRKDLIEDDDKENEHTSAVKITPNVKSPEEKENSASLSDSVGFGNALRSSNEVDDNLNDLVSIIEQDIQILPKQIISTFTESEITISKGNKEENSTNLKSEISSKTLRKTTIQSSHDEENNETNRNFTTINTLKKTTIQSSHDEENNETNRNFTTINTTSGLMITINPSLDEEKGERNNTNISTVNYTSGFQNALMSTIDGDTEEKEQSKSSEEKENSSSLNDSIGFGNALRSSNEADDNPEAPSDQDHQKLPEQIVSNSTDKEKIIDKESGTQNNIEKGLFSNSKSLLNSWVSTEITIHLSHKEENEETNTNLSTANNTSGFRNALMSTIAMDEEENEKSKTNLKSKSKINTFMTTLNDKSSEEKDNLSSFNNSTGFRDALMSSNEVDENLGSPNDQEIFLSKSKDAEKINDKASGISSKKVKGLFSSFSKSKSLLNSWVETTIHQSHEDEKEESNKNLSTVNNTSGFRNALMSTDAMDDEQENEKSNTNMKSQSKITSFLVTRNNKLSGENDNLSSMNNSTGFQNALMTSNEADENSESSNDQEIFSKKIPSKSKDPEKIIDKTSEIENKNQKKVNLSYSRLSKLKTSNSMIETTFHQSDDEEKEETNKNLSSINNTSGFRNALMSSNDTDNNSDCQKLSNKNVSKSRDAEKIIDEASGIENKNLSYWRLSKSKILSNTLIETTIHQSHEEEKVESNKNTLTANNTSGFQKALISLNEADGNINDLVSSNGQDHQIVSKSTEIVESEIENIKKKGANGSLQSLPEPKSNSVLNDDDREEEEELENGLVSNSLMNTINTNHVEEKDESKNKNISTVNHTSGFRNALMSTNDEDEEEQSVANSKTSMLVTSMISTTNSSLKNGDEENGSEEEEENSSEKSNSNKRNKENEKLSNNSKDEEKSEKFANSSIKPVETSLFIKEISSRGHSTERKKPKSSSVSSWIKNKRVKNSTAIQSTSTGYDDWDGISVLSSISSHSAVTMDQADVIRHVNDIENGIAMDYQRELKKELKHLLNEKQKFQVYTKIDKLLTMDSDTTEINKSAKEDNNKSERNKRSNTIKNNGEVKKRKIQSKTQDPDLLVNNKKYTGRLKKPAKWATDCLYKFLQSKCKSRQKSEEIVLFLHKTMKELTKKRKSDNLPSALIDDILRTLYKNSIIKTHWDFRLFVSEYMPWEFRDKVVSSVEFTENGMKRVGPTMRQKTIFEPLSNYYNSDDSD